MFSNTSSNIYSLQAARDSADVVEYVLIWES